MQKKSFVYKWPIAYKLGLKLLHGKGYNKKYNYISGQIGHSKSVLDVACGIAELAGFLHPTSTYRGFDINEKFIRYAQRKGLEVRVGNALDVNMYIPSDKVVLCDAVHHMGFENERSVLENSLNAAKQQLIICEPFKDSYQKMISNCPNFSKKIFEAIFNYLDKDGNNRVRFENIKTKKELEETMQEGYGIIPKQTKRIFKSIGEDLIVTYYL